MTGFHPHPLMGDMKGLWTVTMRANRRFVFALQTVTPTLSI